MQWQFFFHLNYSHLLKVWCVFIDGQVNVRKWVISSVDPLLLLSRGLQNNIPKCPKMGDNATDQVSLCNLILQDFGPQLHSNFEKQNYKLCYLGI